jgi:transcriptional regulator with GAF, ATPase, and Fis domain
LLVLSGVLICIYAVAILWYVQTLPDLGIRSAFTPSAKYYYRDYLRFSEDDFRPEPDDQIVAVGNEHIDSWPALLRVPLRLQDELASGRLEPPALRGNSWKAQEIQQQGICRAGEDVLVRVTFAGQRDGRRTEFACWFVLGKLPVGEVIPSILWFFLKLMLFVVGALVFWKRPGDAAATMFFFLCIVTLGAYMGGYHWSHIVTQPLLILGFMVCAVLLPVVSLHFYLVFPRAKQVLVRHPRRVLWGIYGLPLLFLAALVGTFGLIRFRLGDMDALLGLLRFLTFAYLGVAALWYLASVVCLVHSFRTAADGTERNQVKWILFGALAALLPISYSFYLVVWRPVEFGAGAATWPMFAASVCFTAAFVIGITRYRLMELDQVISSGAVYFLISFLAGLVYYAVVLAGTLIFSQVFTEPELGRALTVSATALVLLLVLDLARSRLKRALDRRFSRQKLHLDRTLQRMGQAIEQLVDPPTLAQRLLQACAELLALPRGAVYLREGEPPLYRLAGCLGPPPALTELSPGCPLVEVMETGRSLAGRPRSNQPVDPAQRQLRFLGGELAQPLTHEGRLLAVLVLGPKEREPYRAEDYQLLAAFAQLTALALESAAGHRTIELLNKDLQAKVEKISEQQRRILALQKRVREWETGTAQPAETAPPTPAAGPPSTTSIIGSSLPVRRLLDLVRKVSTSDAAVLIRGESGTGKELLAKALHDHSGRAAKPFVKVHCAALSQGLLESELFGHVKGAFTGAHRDKIGRFELADSGTLFLDEIGDISWEVQTKLLRVLQEMTFERVGSNDAVRVDVRVIAATHQNLEELIRENRFRKDLYFRLNIISIPVPSLRERVEDIPELALHFLRLFSQRLGKGVAHLDDDALAVLKAYSWPGNVRELENAVQRAVVVAEGPEVTAEELPEEIVQAVDARVEASPADHTNGTNGGLRSEREHRDRHERERLVRALSAAGGNKARAARALGLARSTLVSRLKKHGLS